MIGSAEFAGLPAQIDALYQRGKPRIGATFSLAVSPVPQRTESGVVAGNIFRTALKISGSATVSATPGQEVRLVGKLYEETEIRTGDHLRDVGAGLCAGFNAGNGTRSRGER
jgi:hypothetical protein